MIFLGSTVLWLFAAGAVLSTIAAPRTQEVLDLQEARPLGMVTLYRSAGQTALLTVASFVLAPGQSTLPMVSQEQLLVIVQIGTVRFLSDGVPNRELGRGDDTLGGITLLIPGLGIPDIGGVHPPPESPSDGTAINGGVQGTSSIKAYSLPQGFAFVIDPGDWVQFQGGTQTQVIIVGLLPG